MKVVLPDDRQKIENCYILGPGPNISRTSRDRSRSVALELDIVTWQCNHICPSRTLDSLLELFYRNNLPQSISRKESTHCLLRFLCRNMASLNKLAIRGIRSFDDKQISIIEFFSPVTVIVGHNGSGKTTIIECLKYATTGDQPPNTRGGAFIHDPKMANEKEVKAQVKLRFHAANGTRMLAIRNLSVTVKKTGMTMKTLESILALADGNAEKGGKVRHHFFVLHSLQLFLFTSAGLYLRNVQRWIAKFPSFWVFQKLFSRMSYFVIKKILTGL